MQGSTVAAMMAGGRPKASGGGKWRYLLPALVGCHLFLSFCFVQYFMPSDTPGMGLSLGNANDQVCTSRARRVGMDWLPA